MLSDRQKRTHLMGGLFKGMVLTIRCSCVSWSKSNPRPLSCSSHWQKSATKSAYFWVAERFSHHAPHSPRRYHSPYRAFVIRFGHRLSARRPMQL